MKNKVYIFLAILLAFAFTGKAQLSGYSQVKPITVYNTATVAAVDYQLKLTINTQSLISATQMQSNGDDIRFGKTCNGSVLYNHWLESGINTTTTSVWVKIDSIPAGGSRTFYFFHDNSSATSASSIPGVFIGLKSATDSVASGAAGGVANSQRGFRFSPNEDILVTDFGKREPTGTTRYVTLFDNATTNIITQIQVSGPAATYSYAPLTNPIWLTQGTQYVLQLFQGTGDGYYYGTSSQINSKLTYYDMPYCNSCTQNTFPTSVLSNYHYGYPDLHFYWKNNITPAPTYSIGQGPSISVAQSASSVCPNASVSISASTTAAGFTYTWNPGGITSASITVTPSVSTTYTVSGSQTGCTAGSTNTVSVNVYALPSVSATSSNTLICVGQSATLTANGAGSYSWAPTGSGSSIVVSPTVTANYTVTGTSTVTGCSNTSIVTQNVSACTGINALTTNNTSFNVFPNPNNGKFVIELEADAQIEIYNTLGEVIFNESVKKGRHTIHLHSSAQGVYFIKSNTNGKSAVSKIVVE